MKALFDTSVLVAALVEIHPAHARSRAWLERVARGKVEMFVSTHTLAELYASLTAMPLEPRIQPAMALRLIQENVLSRATLVALDAQDYTSVIEDLARLGIQGGATYDGLHAFAAERAGVTRLLTLNPQDFRRVWPRARDRVREP